MPTDLENAKLMFLCLQFSTATAFDYKKIGDDCKISAGAASKRMSRLKQAVKEGKENGLDVRYLWSCIQHSDMNNVDFKAVGQELDLNAGAASKRWSRLKQALERGETGSTAAAAPAGKQGGSSNGKKGAVRNRKRQNSETAGNEEDDTSTVKKVKRNSSTRMIKTEEYDDNDDETSTEAYKSDDTAEGIVIGAIAKPEKNSKTTVKKPAPAHSQAAATIGGPVKTSTITFTAAPDSPPSPASAPPRRRRGCRPLTDEEVYRKLNVDEAEENIQRSIGAHKRTYPRGYNLRETFEAMRTPESKATANAFDNIAIPGESDDADSSVTPSRDTTSNDSDASPSKAQKKRTVEEVFAAIADDAMKSPSGAEERQRMKQLKAAAKEKSNGSESDVTINADTGKPFPASSANIGSNGGGAGGGSAGANDDWYRVPQNLPNPFYGPPLAGANESSFFNTAVGEDEEYC